MVSFAPKFCLSEAVLDVFSLHSLICPPPPTPPFLSVIHPVVNPLYLREQSLLGKMFFLTTEIIVLS